MVGINLDEAALARLDGAAKAAALETVEAVKTDLVSGQTVPFDTGTMQGACTRSSLTRRTKATWCSRRTARRPGGCIIIRSTISSAGRTQTPGPPGPGLMKQAGRKKALSPIPLRRG